MYVDDVRRVERQVEPDEHPRVDPERRHRSVRRDVHGRSERERRDAVEALLLAAELGAEQRDLVAQGDEGTRQPARVLLNPSGPGHRIGRDDRDMHGFEA